MNEIVKEYQDLKNKFIEKKKTGAKYVGIPTGYYELDDILDGLWDGQFYTIAASPSVGKTMVAVNWAYNIATSGSKVVFYSLEMSRVELYMRLLGIYAGLYGRKILKNMDDKTMLEIEERFAKKFTNMNLHIETDLYEYEKIVDDMIERTQSESVDVFFLDYMQNLLSTDARATEYQLLSKASREIQTTARECEKPIVVMSQVTKGHDATSQSAGAKGTGAIHEVSDIYMELDRPERMNDSNPAQPELKLIIKKNRHGRVGSITTVMDIKCGKIISLLNDDEIKGIDF